MVLASCGSGDGWDVEGTRLADADALFQRDPTWLGAEGGATVKLDDERTLWLFGDTFVATSPARTRRESTVVHNSAAIMTGRDPATATLAFATPIVDGAWATPTTGVRVPGGPLVLFVTDRQGGLVAGARAVRIADPSGSPDTWIAESFGIGDPIACAALDGDRVVGIAVDHARNGRLVSYAPDGDFTDPVRLTDAIDFLDVTTCTMFHDAITDRWAMYTADASGAIVVRWAEHSRGSWQRPLAVYTPPSAVRHDTLIGDVHVHDLGDERGMLATFVEHTQSYDDLIARETELWWPRFVQLDYYEVVQ